MAKKKNTQISTSQEENAQAGQVLEHYQQIAATLHTSEGQQQIDTALAEINALPENAQMALLKDLSKERQVDAADILAAIYEFSASKIVRKEARRSLIQLEGAKIYPHWQPPAEQAPALNTLQLTTNPPRFWKGFVTDSRESGEFQLILAWQQGEDYKEVRLLSFLLEIWHDGVKDFFTQLESKRSFENLINHISNSMPDMKLKDCSLAEGRRLLREALAINTRYGTKPHRDYQLHVSLINQLILEAPGTDEEQLLEEEEENGLGFADLQGLPAPEVVSSFVEFWVDGDYELAYHLLAQDSPLREGLSMDEWIERRDAWADTFNPDDLEPGLLLEREVPKSKLWLPNSFNEAPTPTSKEIEAAWSIELDETPLDDKLPELPAATAVYAETGRHWFWASYTLVQENDEWRIQGMTDEGAQARDLSVEELRKRVQQLDTDAEQRAGKLTPEEAEQMSESEALLYTADILQVLLKTANYMDALLTKLPQERSLYEEIASFMLMLGEYERCLIYLIPLVERFSEEHGLVLRRIAQVQRLLSEEFFEQDDDERGDHFEELAKKALQDSLAIEESLEAHLSLAELLINEGEDEQLDEAEEHLHQARELMTTPDEEAHIELHLGEIATAREQYQEALKHYQRIAEIRPTSAEAWFDIGDVHEMLEDVEEAAANYRRAIELEPDNISYYSTLGLLYKHHDQPEQAIQVLEDGIRANPDSADLLAYRSVMYAESGDYQQANRLLDKAEQLDPENELVHSYRLIFKTKRSAASPPKKFVGAKKKGHHHH